MIKVSILCLTYNQEKYIRQTLEGFMMQKTDFEFEVLVHDDASTDRTPDIIKEFVRQYPGIIKPIFRRKNLYSQGIRNLTSRFLLPKAKGLYIAMCEGDDYWTDPQKLQAQADFMDNHPDFALCFHPVRVLFEDKKTKGYQYPREKSKFSVQELLMHNFIHTNSVMYKRQTYVNMPTDIMPGDWYLHLYHAQFGKIGYIDKVMAVYRKHSGGIWWNSQEKKADFWEKQGMLHLAFYAAVLDLYGDRLAYRKIIHRAAYQTLQGFLDTGVKQPYVEEALTKFPDLAAAFLTEQHNMLRDASGDIKRLQHEVELKENHIQNLQHRIQDIESSRAWKAARKLQKIVRWR